MRRSQTLASKHHARPSISTLAAHDELGAIREAESPEDTLRRQLAEKDQEIRELHGRIHLLTSRVEELTKDHQAVEMILESTQKDNADRMAEIECHSKRELRLERELARFAGEQWEKMLGIPTIQELMYGTKGAHSHFSDGESASPVARAAALPAGHARQPSRTEPPAPADRKQTRIEDLRSLILAMEQRQDTRVGRLEQKIQEAEAEGQRFEELRKQIQPLAQ
ncbi:hypothetical protein PC9H_002826 [Pleurotus ostreatus]|uniref:Uncharacterized protein n=1 Tax=Pleurotus ostreatus TaxID=5322 RepID=A0A8H6ZX70_PLEOS|nr:uncharacterized protein PC9H_002826 [Pleurotus ostreatus]KAF7436000.1 hypothetical protein PC9H_002826 [Pleurotus ostreatus]KAJ8688843.1 hypothetical protein PTI98_013588 [Pleurotus ostreatus]